jgi:hypothetical protein
MGIQAAGWPSPGPFGGSSFQVRAGGFGLLRSFVRRHIDSDEPDLAGPMGDLSEVYNSGEPLEWPYGPPRR